MCVCPANLPPPGFLQETTVEVMDQSKCVSICIRKVTKNMICAGTSSGGRGPYQVQQPMSPILNHPNFS